MNTKFHIIVRCAAGAWLAATLGLAAADADATLAAAAKAPDFTLPAIGGTNLRLQEQRGRVVMVNFWATWCAPCRVEMPHLNRLYDKYRGSGFVLLGVNIDEEPRKAADLAARLGLRFPVLFDTEKKVSRLYDLSAMPSTVLIDRDGRVRYIHRGYRDGYEDTYEKQIRELLKE
jgi:peroxiredoxin